MADNIQMPKSIRPITSPRPIKPVNRQSREKRDQRFEDHLKSKDEDTPQEQKTASQPESHGRNANDSQPNSKKSPEHSKTDDDAGQIIDIHA